MRGLVCLALENQFGKSMGLRYMREILDESLDLESHKMIPNRAPSEIVLLFQYM